jgi:hypothetical protein
MKAMIEQQYFDEQSDHCFDNLLALAEHYDDDSDYYEISGLPSKVYVCRLGSMRFGTAQRVAKWLLKDFCVRREGDKLKSFYHNWTNAESLTDSAAVNFYENCDNCDFRIPVIKGIEELQRSLDIFTAINKPFWRLGGDSMIGLCIINRALRKIECENADVHCLWYSTRERIELTDRVWTALKLQNWRLIDGEWRAIA